MKSFLAAVSAFAFMAAYSAPAFSQGSGYTDLGQMVSEQQEEITRPCKDLTGWDKVACIKNRTKELFREAHPCVPAAMEKPCSHLAGPKRSECIKQQWTECRAKRKEFKAERKEKFKERATERREKRQERRGERKEKFMNNHPCASAVIFTPCSAMTGKELSSCRKAQMAKCKAKRSN